MHVYDHTLNLYGHTHQHEGPLGVGPVLEEAVAPEAETFLCLGVDTQDAPWTHPKYHWLQFSALE